MSAYAPATDRKGRDLRPGDRVSFKVYPRGTAEGVVVVSKTSQTVMPDQSTLPSLAIDSEGRVYGMPSPKAVLKIVSTAATVKASMDKIASPKELVSELNKLVAKAASNPSRVELAQDIRALAEKTAGMPRAAAGKSVIQLLEAHMLLLAKSVEIPKNLSATSLKVEDTKRNFISVLAKGASKADMDSELFIAFSFDFSGAMIDVNAIYKDAMMATEAKMTIKIKPYEDPAPALESISRWCADF